MTTYSAKSIEERRLVIPQEHDIMITKPCSKCDSDVMLRIDETVCMNCKEVGGIV